ncbi:EF-hand domain-containing protein [Sphingomonas sp.]|uniref:EF-hand domain-containing protein n=1 Tax=Sphingomonas sp. TaxID=28214 RepID=UPI003CC68EA8
MWRYLAGAGGALALAGAGVMLFSGHATRQSLLPAAPAAQANASGDADAQELPDTVPAATEQTREQRRFGRYDKDRNGQITRDEFLAARRKAFQKLDRNGDGQLSFDEWAAKAIGRFATADHDHSGAMSAAEFATTRVVRHARARANCPPATQARGRAAPAEQGEPEEN